MDSGYGSEQQQVGPFPARPKSEAAAGSAMQAARSRRREEEAAAAAGAAAAAAAAAAGSGGASASSAAATAHSAVVAAAAVEAQWGEEGVEVKTLSASAPSRGDRHRDGDAANIGGATLSVVVRVRPLSPMELSRHEERRVSCGRDGRTVSVAMKDSIDNFSGSPRGMTKDFTFNRQAAGWLCPSML